MPRSRAARLRRQMHALARAAGEVLRGGDTIETAFTTLAPAAVQALGLTGLSLWQRTDAAMLECRLVWPESRRRGGPPREDAAAAFQRTMRYTGLAVAQPGWLGDSAVAGVGAMLDVPVLIADECWGRMVFESGDRAIWHADEEATARHFADVFGIAVERARRREAEARLAYLEMYDETTGVANRTLFLANLRQRLKRLRRGRGPPCAALLLVDVDRFSSVNEFFGEVGGNRALGELARRLDDLTPDDAVVGRLEGDCFGILLPDADADAQWKVPFLAERALAALAEPLVQEGRAWESSASIGIAFADGGASGFTVEEWLRNADMASKEAKVAGRNRVQVFDPEQHQSVMLRLSIEQGLRDALRDGAIEVAYQPEFDLVTGEILGAEALARWRHPDGRLIAAGEFIEVAEATGLIEPIGRVVMEAACREARSWPSLQSGEPRTVRINVSARQFTGGSLVREVGDALAAAGLHPCQLCLEITETTVMAKAAESMDNLNALKALGICLAIDDFGTGYSSLAYLKRFPVNALKLDKSLVDDVHCDETVRAIIRAVQGLATTLDLDVVVEGVETIEQEAPLLALGIRRVQGFLYARPEPAADFRARLLASRHGAVRAPTSGALAQAV